MSFNRFCRLIRQTIIEQELSIRLLIINSGRVVNYNYLRGHLVDFNSDQIDNTIQVESTNSHAVEVIYSDDYFHSHSHRPSPENQVGIIIDQVLQSHYRYDPLDQSYDLQ